MEQNFNQGISIDEGLKELKCLSEKIDKDNLDWNEAQTRFNIIDDLLIKCLGWSKEQINVENHQNRKFTDYELGKPAKLVLEAKREGRIFELPANPSKKIIDNLPSLLILCDELKDAVEQAQRYCGERGIEYAVICNGHQLVAFIASRHDGVSPLAGKCLVFNGYKHLLDNFGQLWQHLSPQAILERRLSKILTVGENIPIPKKLSLSLVNYPKFRYTSELQNELRTLSEFLLQDIPTTKDIESRFYKECYCDMGALSNLALISKHILEARYMALFPKNEHAPVVQPVLSKKDKQNSYSIDLSEAIAKRPIVLIGDVGVGKTSFLKNLIYVKAYDQFKDAIHIYIDLGTQASLTTDLKMFILNEIENQLFEKYKVDIQERQFVKGIYHAEIERFNKGIYGSLMTTDHLQYESKLIEFLEKKISDKSEHLKKAIQHLSKGRNKQIIIMIDNADQRDFDVQQAAFIVSQEFAKQWDALVFITIRPQTFYIQKNQVPFPLIQIRL